MNKKRKKRKIRNNLKNISILDGRINEKNFLRAVIDNKSKQIRVYSNDMLIKRIHRDSGKIAKSFDKLCNEELIEISELFSRSAYMVGDGLVRAVHDDNEIKITSSKLLMNALITIQASVELLRKGYILQPGMLLRSTVEAVSTVAYFLIEEDGYIKYKDGKLNVNKTIKYGKQVIPPLGYIQGFLSNKFVHIDNLHSENNTVTEYNEMIEPLRINLGLIKASTWLVYVVSELTFYDYFNEHIFWSKIAENGYKFEITPKEKIWMNNFFKIE